MRRVGNRSKQQSELRSPLQRSNWLDSEYWSSYVSTTPTEGSKPYVRFDSRSQKPGYPGLRERVSRRWFREWRSSRVNIPVPYIDSMGKFTVFQLGNWYTYPETWFASVTSTIDSRLWSLFQKRFKCGRKYNTSDRNLITRISLVYAFTHNNYFMDRILATLRPGKLGVVRSIFHSFRTRLGETFRFVYSQTSYQVSWLNFRSKWIRAKPSRGSSDLTDYPFVERKKGKRISFIGGNPYLKTINYLVVNRLVITRDGYWYPDLES